MKKRRLDRAGTNYVYQFLDAAGHVIYVGMTYDTVRRFTVHRRQSPWWDAVTRIAIEAFCDRYKARYREAQLLQEYHPIHNRRLNNSAIVPPRSKRAWRFEDATIAS